MRKLKLQNEYLSYKVYVKLTGAEAGGSFLERQQLDEKIKEVSKVIFSYCRSRTSSQYDAEDLAQDIVVEI